jgi:hypothetical protein
MPMNPRLLVPRATFDPDAAAYLRAVEAADGQALETPVKRAVDDFIKGCKADPSGTPGRSNWDAIKASCILCGARTLAGALVPLAGTAPTNNNFVEADYNRETGLVGNGSTKYLDSNRANDADGQNDNHNAVYVTQANSTGNTSFYIDSGDQVGGSNNLGRSGITENLFARNRTSVGSTVADQGGATGLIGHARSSSSEYTVRSSESNLVLSVSSQSPTSTNVKLYARPGYITEGFSNARLAFYSIGEYLDLALIDARATALVTAIGAAL